MNCPNCQTVMREREKGDLIIDVCPACRGVWLDAGELEKLVAAEERVYERRGWRYDDDDDDFERRSSRREAAPDSGRGAPRNYDGGNRQASPPKKKSFLSSVFESLGEGGVED